MRTYLILHVLIISFAFFLTPTIQASDFDEEIEPYKQAIRINPDDAFAHYNLGIAYFLSNDIDSALEQYKNIKKLRCRTSK